MIDCRRHFHFKLRGPKKEIALNVRVYALDRTHPHIEHVHLSFRVANTTLDGLDGAAPRIGYIGWMVGWGGACRCVCVYVCVCGVGWVGGGGGGEGAGARVGR